MHKDSTYPEKFELLGPWMPHLIPLIKGDLKREHLKRDIAFVKAHFSTKDLSRISLGELTQVYTRVLPNKDMERLGELVTNLWLLKHGDIYRYFESQLSKVTSDFTTLESLDEELSKPIADGAIKEFGPIDAFLFAVLNSVVLSPESYERLQKLAKVAQEQIAKSEAPIVLVADDKDHAKEILRVQEKYEKKLAGLQQKYLHDVDVLKKEITRLRQKLTAS